MVLGGENTIILLTMIASRGNYLDVLGCLKDSLSPAPVDAVDVVIQSKRSLVTSKVLCLQML